MPVPLALLSRRLNPALLMRALLAAPQVWKAITCRKDSPEAQTFCAVPTVRKWEYDLLYLARAGFLAMRSFDTQELIGHPRALRG